MDKKISQVVYDLFGIDTPIQLTRPDPQFGDLATNIAMQIAGSVGKAPREIADEIISKMRTMNDFSEVSVAGPGFINMRLNDDILKDALNIIIKEGINYGKPATYVGKVVVTEYSDPNPFKVLHAGHFYTSVVGDAMSNLIESAGGTVHRVNFGGDVGLHVGKTLWAIIEELDGEYPEKLSAISEGERSNWMAACYARGTSAYEEDEVAKAKIIELNKKIYSFHETQDHDSSLARIYWTCRQWSYDYFNEFYTRIGVQFERYYPESETAPLGLKTVREQKKRGIYQESNGATVFKGEPYGLHTRVFINQAGLPTYEAKDVGLSLRKWEDYHFDESIIITGNDIIEYMKVVLKSIEQFKPELSSRTRHVTHGNVKLAGGVKMSSRKGNFFRAVDVLKIAADEYEKAQHTREDVPVLGAIKYAFLKTKVGPDLVFEPRESVSLQGNSGPYLQYAYVRALSITRKVPSEQTASSTPDSYDIYERALLNKLTEYPDVLHTAVDELAPHYICTYLYELAQTFNRFYEHSRVIGDEREMLRLQLVSAYTIVLKAGLTILGISVPEKM